MSLSDCPCCWDTPCTCGYSTSGLSSESAAGVITTMLGWYSPEQRDEILKFVENWVALKKPMTT